MVTSDYTQKKYTKKQKQLHGAEEPKLEKKITCLWNPQSVILCNFYTYRPTDVNLLPSSGFLHSEEQQLGQNRSLAIIVQYVSYIWVNYNDLTVTSLESWWMYRGIIPKWAARFRLVNYYNLPIYIYTYYNIWYHLVIWHSHGFSFFLGMNIDQQKPIDFDVGCQNCIAMATMVRRHVCLDTVTHARH